MKIASPVRNPKLLSDRKTGFKYHIRQKWGMPAKGRLLELQYKTPFTDNLYFRATQNGPDEAIDTLIKAL